MPTQKVGTIYLLHYAEKLHHTQHYLGYAEAGNLEKRLARHKKGNGGRLPAVFAQAGIGFICVRTWPGTRQTERNLKNHKEGPRLCPICRTNKKLGK